jgi:hypothetical protein
MDNVKPFDLGSIFNTTVNYPLQSLFLDQICFKVVVN